MRTLIVGGVSLLALGLLALGRDDLGISAAWPLLLGLAVALAPATDATRALLVRLGAAVVGVLLGWFATALRMGLLAPDLAVSEAISLGAALLVLALLAIPFGVDALWAGALGIALFQGIYQPVLDADPAGFLSTSPPALVSSLVVLALGAGAGGLARGAAGLIGDGEASTANATTSEADHRA